MTDYASLLVVKLLGGKNLPAADLNGTSDPYCIFRCGRQEVRSSVVQSSLSPFWNETLRLCVPSASTPLYIEVYDRDRVSDDFLGQATVDLGSLQHGRKQKLCVTLRSKDFVESTPVAASSDADTPKKQKKRKNKKQKKTQKDRGQLHLSLLLESLQH